MKRVFYVLVALVVVALAVPASNLIASRPAATSLTTLGAADPDLRPVAQLFEANCANCHTTDGDLPIYAHLPGARGVLQKDVQSALRHLDMTAALVLRPAEPVSEAVLAKIEHEIETHAMPPGRYRAMHWQSHLHPEDREAISNWLRDERRAHYAPVDVPENVQCNVFHPLPKQVAVDARKAALGEMLYHDARLSGDNTVSCATCHDLAKGGTDGERFSEGIHGQHGTINAPTTFNASLQFAQFWDGRAATLEEQAAGPPQNPVEMGSSWDEIVAKFTRDPVFVREFTAVYPSGVNKANLTDAIAEFERTLVTPNARFDRFLMGDVNALTTEEQRGHRLFLQSGCQTCHVGKLLGGQSYEKMGRRADYFTPRGGIEKADYGRFNVTHASGDEHLFKVPTLRNVARTAPYLHDGSAADLKQAVHVMARYQLGIELRDADATAIARFLESLTGEYRGKTL